MTSPTQIPDLVPWNTLQADLSGSFEARAQGLLNASYTLMDRNGNPFARLNEQDAETTLTAGDLEVRIERTSHNSYRMLSEEAELVRAAPAENSTILRIECAGRVYEARLRLLSNVAIVRSLDGRENVRLSGGFAGRRYRAVFDSGVEGALPVAILLLHYGIALRRRIYLAG